MEVAHTRIPNSQYPKALPCLRPSSEHIERACVCTQCSIQSAPYTGHRGGRPVAAAARAPLRSTSQASTTTRRDTVLSLLSCPLSQPNLRTSAHLTRSNDFHAAIPSRIRVLAPQLHPLIVVRPNVEPLAMSMRAHFAAPRAPGTACRHDHYRSKSVEPRSRHVSHHAAEIGGVRRRVRVGRPLDRRRLLANRQQHGRRHAALSGAACK
jgi:hypothetical protein